MCHAAAFRADSHNGTGALNVSRFSRSRKMIMDLLEPYHASGTFRHRLMVMLSDIPHH